MNQTDRGSALPKFDARFVRNVFVAAVLGVVLGLLVAGAALGTSLLVALAVAVVYSVVFVLWGRARVARSSS